MNVKEFFEDAIKDSAKYSAQLDFDTETREAIQKYSYETAQVIANNPQQMIGYIARSVLIGFLLKLHMDKQALENLGND